MDITGTTPKQPQSPASSVSSTEAGCKKHDARNTPERGNTKDNTVSPDTAIGPIDLPPQIEKKTGSHNTSFSPYKDSLTNHTTNKEEQDWDEDSEEPPVNNQTRPPTETLIPLPRTQKLSTNILTSQKGQNKDDVFSISSSFS
jgi:hypothetical protein